MKHRIWAYVGFVIGMFLVSEGIGWSDATKNPPQQDTPQPSRATVRTFQNWDGRCVAEVVVGGQSIIAIYGCADGLPPQQRAEKVAERLNATLAMGAISRTFKIEAPHFEEAITAFGRPIITATFEDQGAVGLSRKTIIKLWHRNLVTALRQHEPPWSVGLLLVWTP